MFGIKIVRQNCKGLVETLGKYSRSVDAGLQFYVPIFQRSGQSNWLCIHCVYKNILLSRKIMPRSRQASL